MISVLGAGDRRRLRIVASTASELRDFEGSAAESAAGVVLEGPLSAINAEALRSYVPGLKPQLLGIRTSAGVGDRLGLATPGHVRAFQKFGSGIVPVFAQQSAREMHRLGRTPQQVMDDAMFGCLQAGWDGPVGADADHLKSTVEIDRCLEAGFTLFTLDPGDHVQHIEGSVTAKQLEDIPWAALEDDLASMTRRYADLTMEIGDGILRLSDDAVHHAAAKYGAAVAYTVSMYRHLMERADYPVEVEVSVDETDDVTTLIEHIYMASELKRLGVTWVSFAPRYVGSFEKGVDYIGEKQVLYTSLMNHSHIARALGPYKISMHSGSDKFSIYEGVAEATGGLVHLKTSGTSYLVALEIAARFDSALFREIYGVSREAYRGARASYQVSAVFENTPEPDTIPEVELGVLLSSLHSRQILHVGYGAVLRTPDEKDSSPLARVLRELLAEHNDAYESLLEEHTGRHLTPFAEKL